ncbi:hypothetical protein [uncultured Alistipes sp.]|uniref:hypothetical protein n=1 Tax=uncultured Alistipes sp. TaxID=538949 RepID=UPI002609BF1F|nr:hypothetical protein [uncultured Alistipes sp.]
MDTMNDSLREEIEALDRAVDRTPDDSALYMRRGKLHHKAGAFDKALNDFLRVRELSGPNPEADGYIDMLREIFAFRYGDLYNP